MAAAEEFIEFLGNLLAKGTGGIIYEGVKTAFKEAVENLPQGELKTQLKKNFNRHLKKLLCYVKSVGKTQESPDGAKSKIKEIKFNLYGRKSLDEVLQSVAHLQSAENRESNCKRLWAACSMTEESEKLFKTLRPSTNDEESDDKKLDSTVRIINTCKQMSIGHRTEQKVASCMKFFLSEISPRCEECFNNSNDKDKQKRAITLKEVLHDVLQVMHFRHQRIHTEDTRSGENGESFEDLLAAMLSLYIDMVLVSLRTDQDKKKLAKSIGNFVFLLLGHSVCHCLDVLLQLSAVSDDNAEVVLPLIRYALRRITQADISCATYIKCICTARLGLKHLGNNSQEERNDIKQVVESIGPPSEFVSWLIFRDERLVKDLCLPAKRTGRKITRHLLDMTDEDCFERLLDLTSDVHHERTMDNLGGEEDEDKEDTPEEVGFFLDAKGEAEMVDIAEEVVYATSKAKEKILDKQLTSLRSRLHSNSESESEDDDQFDFDTEEISKETIGDVVKQKQSSGLDTDDVPVETSVGATVESQDEDADEALMEENVAATVESHIADMDDSQMENSVTATVESQLEAACEDTEKHFATQTRSKAAKNRAAKETKQLYTRSGMRTRGRASFIEVFKDEDVLHITEGNVKHPTPTGKKRKSEKITRHQEIESVGKSSRKISSERAKTVIKPRRMSTRLRKRN